MSHTPGPWRAVPIPDNPTEIAIEGETSYGKKVIGWVRVPRRRLDDKKIEDQANARLIAAAPDLLAELKVAAATLDAIRAAIYERNATPLDSVRSLVPNVRNRERAAVIAKVEGRA